MSIIAKQIANRHRHIHVPCVHPFFFFFFFFWGGGGEDNMGERVLKKGGKIND